MEEWGFVHPRSCSPSPPPPNAPPLNTLQVLGRLQQFSRFVLEQEEKDERQGESEVILVERQVEKEVLLEKVRVANIRLPHVVSQLSKSHLLLLLTKARLATTNVTIQDTSCSGLFGKEGALATMTIQTTRPSWDL